MTANDYAGILKRSYLFKGLDDRKIKQVCEFVMPTEREYDKNQIIVDQGEPVEKIGIIKNGTVISMKYHFNGDAQILGTYKRGEVLSLDAVNTTFLTSPVALISQTECIVILIPYKKLLETDKINPAVKETIIMNSSEILGNELVRLMYKIDVLSKRTLQDRVLTYLCIIGEKKGMNTFDISMNQEQFAQYLCVSRGALSMELNRMRKSGLIDYKKNRYTIHKKINILKNAKK